MEQIQKIHWTPDMDAAMQKHIAAGLSGSKVAEAINAEFSLPYNVTRNAVIGRANRKGINLNGAAKKKPKKKIEPKLKKVAKKKNEEGKPSYAPPPPDENAIITGQLIWQLGHGQCRWTDSDGHPSQFVFCGKKTKPGSSYCEEHHKRVYMKPKKNWN